MSERAQELLREVLALTPDERADVAVELVASLDDPSSESAATAQVAWAKEIERRARRALAGESSGDPWGQVRDRVADRLAKR